MTAASVFVGNVFSKADGEEESAEEKGEPRLKYADTEAGGGGKTGSLDRET